MRQLFLVSFFSIIGLLFSAQAGDNISGLTGDLQGMRSKLLKKGFHFGLAYTGEIYSNLSGGFRQQATYLDIINFRLKIDLGRTLNWHGATLYTDYLGIHGDDPSENVGDIQGVSNIAAPKGWKFHEAWFRQNVFSDKLSLLWGMYDLNTEFDLIETAGLFLNSSHGMGPDFSQGEIFCNRKIFAIAAIGRQHLQRGCPVILFAPVIDVIYKFEAVKEAVDLLEFRKVIKLLMVVDQVAPGNQPSPRIFAVLLFDFCQYLL